MSQIGNFDYHMMLRAANVKATIREIEQLPKPDDELSRMVREQCLKELKRLANYLWEEGMNGTKGINRTLKLFNLKE